MNDFQYPIGKFQPKGEVSTEQRNEWIRQIAETPQNLRLAINDLSEEQLNTPYRPGGWTVRQVVHHLPDSHMNGYIRFRLALTEEQPTVKPYIESRWAEIGDYTREPVDESVVLLESLHGRWGSLLSCMTDSDFAKTFINPESGDTFSLDLALGLYAWHGKHHISHITSLRDRMGW